MNLDKFDVVIFSHPRSGSYWFQETLPHYDMNELFNISNVSIIKLDKTKAICSDFKLNKYQSLVEKHNEYNYRENLFNSVKIPKSVKIHHFQLFDPWIVNWVLKNKKLKIIFFERKDKEQAFYSLLISNELKKFKGLHTKCEIVINLKNIDECYNSIFKISDNINIIKNNFDYHHLYYEDVLTNEIFWIDKSKPSIQKQDTVKNVKIINKEEVDNFIKNRYDISKKRIF